uniref:DUF7795 domain-containing protein n=1 Tax=Salix viminalis TaxID=40686 RepID=A0A6N2N2D0_SALVM
MKQEGLNLILKLVVLMFMIAYKIQTKVHTCLLGLHNHLSQAKTLLNELENLLEDSSGAIQTANGCLPPLKNEDCGDQLYQQITTDQVEKSSLDLGELEMTNYAVLMGIIYSMVKKDYVMQEKIVHSLNLKSLSGELESYCVMWSLPTETVFSVNHRHSAELYIKAKARGNCRLWKEVTWRQSARAWWCI